MPPTDNPKQGCPHFLERIVDPRLKLPDPKAHLNACVHQVISDYNRKGAAAIETPGKGGRNNSYLSLEAEKEFLSSLALQAAAGVVTTATKIKQSFEESVGKEVDKSTSYRMLKRQEWSKRMPRLASPEANPEAQAAFKKTFPHSFNKPYKLESPMTPDQCYCWQPTRDDLAG